MAFPLSSSFANAVDDKAKTDPVAKTCKDKKVGDTVKVDGRM